MVLEGQSEVDLCAGSGSGPLFIHADVSERPPNCTRRSPITHRGLRSLCLTFTGKWEVDHMSAMTDAVRLIYICRARVQLCKHTVFVCVYMLAGTADAGRSAKQEKTNVVR